MKEYIFHMHYYGVLRRISYNTFDFINASWLLTVEQYYNLIYIKEYIFHMHYYGGIMSMIKCILSPF